MTDTLLRIEDDATRNDRAAERFLVALEESAREKAKVLVAFCGGRSPEGLFLALRSDERLPRLRAIGPQLELFVVDERAVPLDDADSNFLLLSKSLFEPLQQAGVVSNAQIHPFCVAPNEADFGAATYSALLRRYGTAFDVVLLGAGEDGHVAGLFPGVSAELSGDYFVGFSGSPKPPSDRVTATTALLLRSSFIMLLFIGEGKREAYELFQAGRTPSALVRKVANHVVVTNL